MPEYKQSFWTIDVGTGDIGAIKRAQIAKAAFALQDHPDVLLSTFAGGRDEAEAPEISLVVAADADVAALQPIVERVVASESLPVKVFLQNEVRNYDLDDVALGYFTEFTAVDDKQEALRSLDRIVSLPIIPNATTADLDPAQIFANVVPTQFLPGRLETKSKDIPSKQIADCISVSSKRYEQLKNATGDKVKDEIQGLNNALDALKKETKTNAAVALMVASGLITVGKLMWTAYGAYVAAGSISAMISGMIAAVGGLAVFSGIVAGIAAVFGLLWVLLKDAVNFLLLVNGQTSPIELVEDSIKNGERKNVVVDIPGAPDPRGIRKPMAYPVGFYVYTKFRLWDDYAAAIAHVGDTEAPQPQLAGNDFAGEGINLRELKVSQPQNDYAAAAGIVGIPKTPQPQLPGLPGGPPVGFYGSCMGIAFRKTSDGAQFSVGMDCPNTIFGGTNCIRIIGRSDAKAVAKLASDSGVAHESVRVGYSTCVVNRAAKLGSTNYGICWIG